MARPRPSSAQGSLFLQQRLSEWSPMEVLPDLSQHKRVWIDTEGSGLNFKKDVAVGMSFCLADGTKGYLPWAHEGGGNLDKRLVQRWFSAEFRDKDIVGLNIKHDNHQYTNAGFNLEQHGNRLHDIAHKAALINEHRYAGLDLNSLAKEFLGPERGKLECPIPKPKIWEAFAGDVAPYAIEDSVLVRDVDLATDPIIAREELGRVLQLEDDIIFAVCEMERNGIPVDVAKAQAWSHQANQEVGDIIMTIWKQTGLKVNPQAPEDLEKLIVHKLRLPWPYKVGCKAHEKYGSSPSCADCEHTSLSFEDDNLEKVDHPLVQLIRTARWVGSVNSKFLNKIVKTSVDGVIYYNLNQLKTDQEAGGTITGRFSSSMPKFGGLNIQQMPRVKDQLMRFKDGRYIVRELFIEEPDLDFSSADAKQIEYRLFAHYANSERVNAEYAKDPNKDFHNVVLEMLRVYRASTTRDDAKNGNFGKVYGAQEERIASTMKISIPEAREFIKIYDQELPEAEQLLRACENVARRRGYVKTILGRRGRFLEMKRLYSALNKVVQGGAADLNKMKLRQVYQERTNVGMRKMRATVHDEIIGGLLKEPWCLPKYRELLDTQCFPLRIPILWDANIGPNWRACK